MAEITAAMVKALREKTGVGMMECKKALDEAHGDPAVAEDILRKKVGAKVEKKADRVISEGLVAIVLNAAKTEAAMVEVRCETDFCARNEVFAGMVAQVADMALKAPAGKVEASAEMTAAVGATLAKIGENMGYARGVKIAAPKIAEYKHHNNKVGVIMGFEGELDEETAKGILHHIAFSKPIALNTSDVPADLVAKERKFAEEQAAESGKPADIVAKMVQGKVGKFLAENALLEQAYVKDDKKKVKEMLGTAKILSFACFTVGA